MATSNRIRALNRLPFDFDDGLKVRGVPLEIMVSELVTNPTQGSSTAASTTVAGSVLLATVQDSIDGQDNLKAATPLGVASAISSAINSTITTQIQDTIDSTITTQIQYTIGQSLPAALEEYSRATRARLFYKSQL